MVCRISRAVFRSNCGGTQWNNRFSLLTRGNGSQILFNDTLSGAGQVNVTVTVDGQVSNTVTLTFQ